MHCFGTGYKEERGLQDIRGRDGGKSRFTSTKKGVVGKILAMLEGGGGMKRALTLSAGKVL